MFRQGHRLLFLNSNRRFSPRDVRLFPLENVVSHRPPQPAIFSRHTTEKGWRSLSPLYFKVKVTPSTVIWENAETGEEAPRNSYEKPVPPFGISAFLHGLQTLPRRVCQPPLPRMAASFYLVTSDHTNRSLPGRYEDRIFLSFPSTHIFSLCGGVEF